MLVTNAIARGRDRASPSSLTAVLLRPRAVHGSRASSIDPIRPVAGPSSTLCAVGDPDRSRRRQGGDRRSPRAYTSEQPLSKPFLKNREKEG
jgi:hypothetical protein